MLIFWDLFFVETSFSVLSVLHQWASENFNCNGLKQIVLMISVNEVSCLGHCLWIPNREFHLKVPVLHVVYCSLTRDVAVSINTT